MSERRIEVPTAPNATPPKGRGSTLPVPPPDHVEEPGTQALADALRSSFVIVKLLMFAMLVYFLCSGVFTVGQAERAIILRFGKPVGDGEKALLGPGLKWAFPYPIDEVVRIPLGTLQTVRSTVGWYAVTAAQEAAKAEPPPGPSLNPENDGYLLTADGNIVHVRGTLRYRINEPGLRYFLGFVGASNVVQNAFNNALVYATARYKVDDILTHDQAGFRETVTRRLEDVIAQTQLGITVDQIDLVPIPPRQLIAQFGAVLQADVQRSKLMNDARSYANQTVSRAQADAESKKNAAETERTRLVQFVATEAKRFNDLLPAYRGNRSLFVQQHLTDAVNTIVTNAETDKIILPDRVGGKPRELRMQLNREPVRPVAPEPPKPASDDDHH